MKNYLDGLQADFEDRINDISVIDTLNKDLITVYENSLREIETEIRNSGKFGGLLKKVTHKISNVGTLEQLVKVGMPDLAPKYRILREHSIVLIVGSFEVFIADVFKSIANYDPDFFSWKDANEKIAIDPTIFTKGFTLGDAIISHLKNKKYSFQDLRSTLEAINNYLGIDLNLEPNNEIRQKIVLATSLRHIIVHNRSIIDKQFLSQIRELTEANFVEGNRLVLEQSIVDEIKDAYIELSALIIQALTQREDCTE